MSEFLIEVEQLRKLFASIRGSVYVIRLEPRVGLPEVSDFELIVVVGYLDEAGVHGKKSSSMSVGGWKVAVKLADCPAPMVMDVLENLTVA